MKNRIRSTNCSKSPSSRGSSHDSSFLRRLLQRVGGVIFAGAVVCGGLCLSVVADAEISTPLNVSVGPVLRVRQVGGSIIGTRFVRGRASLVDDVRLAPGMMIDLESGTYHSRSSLPVRIVTLWTGEVLPVFVSGSVEAFSGETPLTVRFYGDPTFDAVSLSRGAVASIRQPIGCVDLSPDGVTSAGSDIRVRSLSPTDIGANLQKRDLRLAISPPVDEGLVIVAGRWAETPERAVQKTNLQTEKNRQTGKVTPNDVVSNEGSPRERLLRFVFRDKVGSTEVLELASQNRQTTNKQTTLRLPDGRLQTVPDDTSELLIRLQSGAGFTVSSHARILARATKPVGQLVAIEAQGLTEPAFGDDSGSGFFLTEPLIRRVDRSLIPTEAARQNSLSMMCRVMDEDRVVRNSGDEIFGAIVEATHAVVIRDLFTSSTQRRIERREVAAVCFRRPSGGEVASEKFPVAGVFSQIDLVADASCSLAGREERFWIRAAIVSAERDGLRLRHPLLGDLTVGWSMVRRVTPLFEGSYDLLDAGPRHLGNGHRESFRKAQPDGTQLTLKFSLNEDQLASSTFLSVDVAELIPAGAGTLKATPFLEEVTAGFLATEVFLKGHLVGTLNELIVVRSPSSDPERVRLRLPARLITVGENSIQIRQTAAMGDAASFDDCELRAIAVEVEFAGEK